MKELIFHSKLAGAMSHFIALKQQSCSDYSSQARLLLYLDRGLVGGGYGKDHLTREILSDHLSSFRHLAPRTFANRYSVIRQFSIHLQQDKERSYVLPKRPTAGRDASRPPYIYTPDELSRLLSASNLPPLNQPVGGQYRTLFSLLYTTGIRIGEALSLDHGDYLAGERLLHIRCGKFHKERYLILSASMAQQMKSYLQTAAAPSAETAMFLNTRGARLTHNSVHGAFRKAIAQAGIIKHGSTGPRIHDLRHTFAVHRLLQWYEQGADVNAKLPHLSTYMGHVDILSTQVYLHPFEQLMAQGAKRFHRHFSSRIRPS